MSEKNTIYCNSIFYLGGNMKNRFILTFVCLQGALFNFAIAGAPYWNYQNPGGGNNHLIFATPPDNSSDSKFTSVYIGSAYQPVVPSYMLNVSSWGAVKNGISGFATESNTIGVFGGNNNGIGVQGWAYYNYGVNGKAGDGGAGTLGAGGWFQHTNVNGTALVTDKGAVRFSNSGGSAPVVNVSYTGTDYFDHIAVQGTSIPQPNFGYGGWFNSGYIGVRGEANSTGPGWRYGGYFVASGGAGGNHAIEASVNTNTGDNWAGYFNGRVYSTGGYQPSDEKLKKDVSPLDGSIDKIMKLKPVSYFYKTDEYGQMGLPKDKQNGLIAQEIETVFPELVCETALSDEKRTEPGYRNQEPKKIKAVNYTALIPILTRAIQEQQQTILEMKKEITALKNSR